jgi:hypothetical protein
MSNSVNLSLVMVWIESSTKQGLVVLQRYTNNINARAFNYAPPMKDGNKWIVWFYADPTRDVIPTEADMKKALKQMESN